MIDSCQPLITVIIPAFNQARYLGQALNSLLAQTYRHWNCKIIDDGSTDHTVDVANQYLSCDERFQYVRQENKGLSAARNRGLELADGKYIQFLDADDWIEPRKFELQVQELKKTEAVALCYTDYYCVDEMGRRTPGFRPRPHFQSSNALHDLISHWETEISIPVHCFLFDARCFRPACIPFDESLANHEDWACWMLVLEKDPKIFFLNLPLAVYRRCRNSMSQASGCMRNGFLAAIDKALQRFSRNSVEYHFLLRKRKITKMFYSPWRWFYWRKYVFILKKCFQWIKDRKNQVGI
jgi:hypothetical protein